MPALDPAVAAIRSAVRSRLDPDGVLVACSGGADSLALAAATAFVAPRQGVRAGLVTVDHGLQEGSAKQARVVAEWAGAAGLDPVVIETVRVAGRVGGPEAAAREARYEALVRAAREHGIRTILLGHTRDDQAETVLLALLRGAGPRGIAGMPAAREQDGVHLVRPLLGLARTQTGAACAALGLTPWADPHNDDPAYGRVRARALLADLVTALGPGVVDNLARTAGLVAADATALDAIARSVLDRSVDGAQLRLDGLTGQADAVRTRVLHAWARSLGVPGTDLSQRHVEALDALVTAYRGQGPVHLPTGITVARRGTSLRATPPP